MLPPFAIIICGALYALIAWKKPPFAIYGIALLLPSYLIRFQVLGIPMTFLELMILLLVVVSVAERRIDYKRIYKDLFFWPAVAVIVIATLAAIVSPAGVKAWGAWKAFFIEPVLFYWLMLSLIKSRRTLEGVFWSLGISAIVVSLFAIWQKFSGYGVPEGFLNDAGGVDRVVGFFGYPNALGLFLGPIIVVYVGFLKYNNTSSPLFILSRTVRFWIKFSAIVVSLLVLFLAKSEGAILAIAVVVWLLLFTAKKTRIFALFLAVFCIIMIVALPGIRDFAYIKLFLLDASGGVRRLMWGETWQLLKDNWLWGGGLSYFQEAIKAYHGGKYPLVPYPHNVVFNFWSELGILGLLTFVWLGVKFIYLNCKNIFKIIADYSQGLPFDKILSFVLLLVFLQMLIHGLVDAPYFKNDLSVLFWIIFGAASLNCSLKDSGKKEC